MYASRRMVSRLAARDEPAADSDRIVPDYVRRKGAQGKRDPRQPR